MKKIFIVLLILFILTGCDTMRHLEYSDESMVVISKKLSNTTWNKLKYKYKLNTSSIINDKGLSSFNFYSNNEYNVGDTLYFKIK